jgi:pectate lyase
MSRNFRYSRLLVLIVLLNAFISHSPASPDANQGGSSAVPAADRLFPAFPTAEGFGAFTPGGRGGKIYIVTTLEDYDDSRRRRPISGSFREAIEAKGPRIVVFRVSGTIHGKNPFIIKNPYITIAGQTSPGGICISRLEIKTHDVVVRYMRIRDAYRGDVAGGVAQNCIFDHCSISWGDDEVCSFSEFSNNVTIQWNIICYGPHPHSMGSLIEGMQGITIHHNLYAHLWYRTPRIDGKQGFVEDIRNNVVYNFGGEPMYPGGAGMFVNIVSNYFKEGPSTPTKPGISGYVRGRPILLIDKLQAFIGGNYYYGRDDLNSDNWKMVSPHIYCVVGKYDTNAYNYMTVEQVQEAAGKYRDTLIRKIKMLRAAPFAAVNTDTAEQAYEKVLARAGAYLPTRDSIDSRVVDDTRNGTGVIINRDMIGAYPTLTPAEAPPDGDMDGMSDTWERLNRLDPCNPADAAQDADNDGYTNVEEYLNLLAQDPYTGGVNPREPFVWVYPPVITSRDTMYFGRPTGLTDWLQCFGDFQIELPIRFVGSTSAVIESPDKDAEIRYTLDGSEPDGSANIYKGPLEITKSLTVRAKAFKQGRESVEVFKKFIADVPRKAEVSDAGKLKSGLVRRFYKVSGHEKIEKSSEASYAPVPEMGPTQSLCLVTYKGYIKIPTDGVYKFNFVYPSGRADEEDSCTVKIGGETILCTHKTVTDNVVDTVALEAGVHPIEVVYRVKYCYNIGFYWQGPGIEEQKAPTGIFFCDED